MTDPKMTQTAAQSYGAPETDMTDIPDPAIAPAEHPTGRPQHGDGSAVPEGWAQSTTSPVASEPQPSEGQRGPSGDETDDSGEDSIPG